jgi:hypothetical protein
MNEVSKQKADENAKQIFIVFCIVVSVIFVVELALIVIAKLWK